MLDLGRGEQLRRRVGARATHAPHPMHAAPSNAASAAVLWHRDEVGVWRRSGGHRDVAAGLDDAIERDRSTTRSLMIGNEVARPRLDNDGVAIAELAHVELTGGRGSSRARERGR